MRVLNSLPRQHQDYFFAEVRKLCANYIASLRIPLGQRESESLELFSEVMAKLLGVAGSGTGRSAQDDDGEEDDLGNLAADKDPRRDERVQWLISEIRGRHALAHRNEDMRRRLYGRWREGGYRMDQLAEEHVTDLAADTEDPHDEKDNRRAWLGLLAAAGSEFEPTEDVSLLLNVMANDPEIQAEFGTEWPVTKIVAALNQRGSKPLWNDDRVENAKKRLKNWIGRLKREHGLDATDLVGLFAKHARIREDGDKIATVSRRQSRANIPAVE
ncbi:MAG: hypothetical protein K8F62_10455 [Pseudorhodoplanes sp.]|nr:hypothetical protein [Pseudorhodoplanes sp.]